MCAVPPKNILAESHLQVIGVDLFVFGSALPLCEILYETHISKLFGQGEDYKP